MQAELSLKGSEIPFYLAHHENQGKNDHQVKAGDQVIEGFAVLFKTPPDHDPDVGNEKRYKDNDIIDYRDTVFQVFFRTDLAVRKKQYQVYKSQKEGQVYKVG
jgi:hypothetical protein